DLDCDHALRDEFMGFRYGEAWSRLVILCDELDWMAIDSARVVCGLCPGVVAVRHERFGHARSSGAAAHDAHFARRPRRGPPRARTRRTQCARTSPLTCRRTRRRRRVRRSRAPDTDDRQDCKYCCDFPPTRHNDPSLITMT